MDGHAEARGARLSQLRTRYDADLVALLGELLDLGVMLEDYPGLAKAEKDA